MLWVCCEWNWNFCTKGWQSANRGRCSCLSTHLVWPPSAVHSPSHFRLYISHSTPLCTLHCKLYTPPSPLYILHFSASLTWTLHWRPCATHSTTPHSPHATFTVQAQEHHSYMLDVPGKERMLTVCYLPKPSVVGREGKNLQDCLARLSCTSVLQDVHSSSKQGSNNQWWDNKTLGINGWLLLGGFHRWGYPKMDGLEGKILLKWMIWGYPQLWKSPFDWWIDPMTKGIPVATTADLSPPSSHGWNVHIYWSRMMKKWSSPNAYWLDYLVGGLVAIFYFPIYWEESSQLTNIFQRGSNHQPVMIDLSVYWLNPHVCYWNPHLCRSKATQPCSYSLSILVALSIPELSMERAWKSMKELSCTPQRALAQVQQEGGFCMFLCKTRCLCKARFSDAFWKRWYWRKTMAFVQTLSMFLQYGLAFRTRVLKTRVPEHAFWVDPFFQ